MNNRFACTIFLYIPLRLSSWVKKSYRQNGSSNFSARLLYNLYYVTWVSRRVGSIDYVFSESIGSKGEQVARGSMGYAGEYNTEGREKRNVFDWIRVYSDFNRAFSNKPAT